MRFMMLMMPEGYGDAEPGTEPDPEGVKRMMAYNEELEAAGGGSDAGRGPGDETGA